ncbi:MAG: tyrosine-type recombinase/integrase [Defluviitaleaceae bacterium]|nr:tyrosine-type recombinase/integrase [Defluviitaleaceae bacterium]
MIITCTLTGLRPQHTFATILLEERENPKIVADLMGHTKVSTTLDLYSHVVDNDVYVVTARTLDGA